MTELPHAREAERNVISGVAVLPQRWAEIRHLTPDHFIDGVARQAFTEIAARMDQGRGWMKVEELAPVEWLTMGDLSIGMWAFESAVREVEAAYVRRRGYLIATEIAKAAINGDTAEVQRIIGSASLPTYGVDGEMLETVVARIYDEIGQDQQNIVPTGFAGMDRFGVLRRREAMGIGARPSMGKSQLGFQMAYHVATHDGVAVVASLEMAAEELGGRIAGALSGISVRDARDPLQVEGLSAALAKMIGVRSLVVVDRGVTTSDLWGICRRVKDEHGHLDLVVADHVRLFKDQHTEERHRLGQITHNLRAIAKDLNTAVVPLVQLSRAPEGRKDQRPGLSDLRDSGEIEENLDVVAFIYRAAYYDRDAKTQSGPAEVYAQKNRNGPLWHSRLYFDAENGPRFADTTAEGRDIA